MRCVGVQKVNKIYIKKINTISKFLYQVTHSKEQKYRKYLAFLPRKEIKDDIDFPFNFKT